jgi:pantetheine-phosphate adenylyltransferase
VGRKILAWGAGAARWWSVRTVIYPGSFDPLTNGHLDVIVRASKLFDHVIVAVADNRGKKPLFTLAERKRLLRAAVKDFPNVSTSSFSGLLVDFAADQKACAIIRGLRAVSDFEFEFQMALMNRRLRERIETVFMMPRGKYIYLSSSLVKEVAGLGGEVAAFVPGPVERALRKKLQAKRG